MQELASEEHAKVLQLQDENAKLRAAEQSANSMKADVERLQGIEREYRRLNVNPKDLETFINNKDEIRGYLKLFPMLVE
jgi:hypothetical protein